MTSPPPGPSPSVSPAAASAFPIGAGRWGRRVSLALGLAVGLVVTACSNNAGVQTEVVQLDSEAVEVLSEEMAECVRDTLGVELPDDFLAIGERMPVDTDYLPPETEQAFAACMAEANGVPVAVAVDGG